LRWKKPIVESRALIANRTLPNNNVSRSIEKNSASRRPTNINNSKIDKAAEAGATIKARFLLRLSTARSASVSGNNRSDEVIAFS
jgi:hypothetical protein